MAESNDNVHDAVQKTWKRRGLFAAAAAAVAGLVAKVSDQRVEARTDGDVVLGALNVATSQTTIQNQSPGGTALDAEAIWGGGTSGIGLQGSGGLYGVHGVCHAGGFGGAGVYGEAPVTATAGVWGANQFSKEGSGVGVRGDSLRGTGILGTGPIGVQGTSDGVVGVGGGVGVFGNIPAPSPDSAGIAIYGVNASSYTGSIPGTGGWGVAGISRFGHGVVGATSANGAGAVVGNAYGIAGAWAGIFFGRAIVEGDFTVLGAKSAAVPHPDGSHRRLYCVESPESWFEDFGKGQLTCGQADVPLDPDFAAVVDLDDYHVFLTAYDADHLLHVTNQTKAGFRVQAQNEGAGGRFSWRVVAKRKDIASPRFEPVIVPPKPEMPTIPDPPAMPTPPVMRRQH